MTENTQLCYLLVSIRKDGIMENIYRVSGYKFGSYARYSFNYPGITKDEAKEVIKEKKAIGCTIQIYKNDKEVKEV